MRYTLLLLILVLTLCSFVEGKRSGKKSGKRSGKKSGNTCLKKVRKYQRCLDNGFKSSLGCPYNSAKSMKKYKKKRCAKRENAAKACEELSCEVEAEWGDFGDWSECTAECGGGTKSRFRTCNHSDEEQCLGESSESVECGTLPCPSGPICENKFTFPGQWDVTFQESGSVTLKNLAGDREDAYGTVDMSQTPYTGNIHHPDAVNKDFTFWFYPDEGSFYFNGDKGKTTNIWKNARCSYAQIVSHLHTAETCEHSGIPISINCGEEMINIKHAAYGVYSNENTCGLSYGGDCISETSLQAMKERCDGKNSCAVEALNSIFGDPCGGIYKYLTATWECHSAPVDCVNEADGSDYRGTVSVTVSGNSCQRWDSQFPNKHDRNPENYPDSGLQENYCRNPDGESGAWCYNEEGTTPRWELCDIPICGTQ